MSALEDYAEKLATSTLTTNKPVTISELDCPYTFNSIRAALSRLKYPIRTFLAGDSLVVVPNRRKQARQVAGPVSQAVELENRIETKRHSIKILAAARLLVDHCIIESFTIVGMSEQEFRAKYPEVVDWFEITNNERGVILL